MSFKELSALSVNSPTCPGLIRLHATPNILSSGCQAMLTGVSDPSGL